MKKSRKLLCVLLALVMVVGLLPGMAFAADVEEEVDAEVAAVDDAEVAVVDDAEAESIGDLIPSIPTYLVYCKLSSNLPAAHAEITLTNQLTKETKTYTANALGLAFIPKDIFAGDFLGVYTVSATCNGPLTGLKYASLPGITWTAGPKVDGDTLVLYPVLTIGLNYEDHFSYMIGYEDGTVRPSSNITRAEAATIIYRMMTPESRGKYASKTNSFNDVNAGDWHNNAVSTLTNAGVIKGRTSTTFDPNGNITRGEFATMIGRLFSVTYTGGNMFGDLNGHWASQYINLLAKLGIMKGDGNGNANPDANITRAETAAMVNRLLGRMPVSTSADSCTGAVKSWPDNPKSAWYYGDIMEATNSHNYTLTLNLGNAIGADTIFCEQWTSIRTDTPDWSALQK